jgi:hypothetical protein
MGRIGAVRKWSRYAGGCTVKEGGGCLAIFGLPFLGAGIMMALSALGLAHIKTEPDSANKPLLLAAMSLPFAIPGALMVFGRRWTTIDVTRGTLVRQYGLLVPFKTREWLLSDFSAVVLTHNPGDSDSGESFPVRLRHRAAPADDIVLDQPRTFAVAHELAEYLSGLLRVELVDTTTDHELVIAPGKAGVGLRERVIEEGAGEQPVAPPNMRSTVDMAPGETTIVIPSGGRWFSSVLSVLVPLFVVLWIVPGVMRFLSRTDTPRYVQIAIFGVLAVIFIVPTIFMSVNLMMGGKRKKTVVKASKAGLQIQQVSGLRSNEKVIAADDLLDLDCSTAEAALRAARNSSSRVASATLSPEAEQRLDKLKRFLPSRGIVIKSRTELFTIGEGLPASELQYLTWVLRRALSGE